MNPWRWQVTSNDEKRADRIILKAIQGNQPSSCMPMVTRTQLQKLIESHHVTYNGKPIQGRDPLKLGGWVEIYLPQPKTLSLQPKKGPLDILYEDEYLLVINKPTQLIVHPSAQEREETLVHFLLHHIPHLNTIGDTLRPGIVHRLDKDTSGALVISKTNEAHQALAKIFAQHQLVRKYWALCYQSPTQKSLIRIETLIGRNTKDRKRMTTEVQVGKKAISHYQLLATYSQSPTHPFASWIEVTLETGRTHQVRVHMTSVGNSLLGDPTYGTPTENQWKWKQLPQPIKDRVQALPGQALHARTLEFQHPITQKPLSFKADPPTSFSNLLEDLARWQTWPEKEKKTR